MNGRATTPTARRRPWAGPAAALALVLAAPDGARAATTFTFLTSTGFARHVAGSDLLVGTADDPTPAALPGSDNQPGTADDLFANPAGATSYLRIGQLPLGGDYDVFASGSVSVRSWIGLGSPVLSATDFTLSATTAQTNGLVGTLNDTTTAPHVLQLASNGSLTGALTLRSCVSVASSCSDLRVTLGGGALTNSPGLNDPARLSGLSAAQRTYLGQMKALAPVGWTQIWLLTVTSVPIGSANVSGVTAPFLVGGRASLVVAMVTSDRSLLPSTGDTDGDGVLDASDNCRFASNASQTDRGGVGTSSPADGIGDACQCGDVSGDGRVTLTDALLVSRSLLSPPTATLPHPELCDVGGAPNLATQGCSVADVAVLRRVLVSPPSSTISAQCRPSLP